MVPEMDRLPNSGSPPTCFRSWTSRYRNNLEGAGRSDLRDHRRHTLHMGQLSQYVSHFDGHGARPKNAPMNEDPGGRTSTIGPDPGGAGAGILQHSEREAHNQQDQRHPRAPRPRR